MLSHTSQFLVIDDKLEHLTAISSGLSQLGIPSLSIHYGTQDENKLKQHCKSVRVIFSDLQLTNLSSTDNKTHYSTIVGLLDDLLESDHPPYLLILWTEYAENGHKEGLMQYFKEGNQKEPIDILCFSKNDLIDSASGEVKDKSVFLKKLKEKIVENKGLNALLQWDAEVRQATNKTLLSIENLALLGISTNTSFSDSTSNILRVLAREAVGDKSFNESPSEAINLALAPLFLDNLTHTKNEDEFWENILIKSNSTMDTKSSKIKEPKIIGQYNTLFHLAKNNIYSYQLGSITKIPNEKIDDCLNLFNIPNENFKDNVSSESLPVANKLFENIKFDFKIIQPNIYITKISASCDYAQRKEGSEQYYLTLKVPVKSKKFNQELRKLPQDYIWVSPLFYDSENIDPYVFMINVKRIITYKQLENIWATNDSIESDYRFKEQLVLQLQRKIADFHSRLGITEIRWQ